MSKMSINSKRILPAPVMNYNHNLLLLKSKNDKFHTRAIDWGNLFLLSEEE